VAAAASAHDLPFICVPAGTRNHFALDLGVERHDVMGALDPFTEGVERRTDLAEVNGRTFLNNISLGSYGEAVRQSAYRDAKVRTLMQTAEQVLGPSGRMPALAWSTTKGASTPASPSCWCQPVRPGSVGLGSRPSLESGRLGILLLDARTVETSLQAGPGPHLTSTSSPRLPCTRESMARR
jgi:hypothetical protein